MAFAPGRGAAGRIALASSASSRMLPAPACTPVGGAPTAVGPANGLPSSRSSRPRMLAALACVIIANAAVETLNGVLYISPLRNAVTKALFGVPEQDFYSPTSGALMFLGGMHAAVGIQCWRAVFGCCSVKETLKLMVTLHAMQAVIGIVRAVKATLAGKLATPTVDAFMGAGGGPAIGALTFGALSLAALR